MSGTEQGENRHVSSSGRDIKLHYFGNKMRLKIASSAVLNISQHVMQSVVETLGFYLLLTD